MTIYKTPLGYEITPKEMDSIRDEIKKFSNVPLLSTNEVLRFVDIFKTLTNTGELWKLTRHRLTGLVMS